MLVLCAVLTALQYRWTGEIARAEAERLRANIAQPARELARAFDAELTAACTQLIPTSAETDAKGREAAQLDRVRRWLDTKPRPIFSRIAIATREESALKLLRLDRDATPMPWPDEWNELRTDLTRRLATPGGPRFESRDGLLLDFAVFGGPRARGGANVGWLILELDRDYLRGTWLPELANQHLQTGAAQINEIEITAASDPALRIFASSSNPAGEPQATAKFHHSGRANESDSRWIMSIRQRPGELEAIVAASRRRNLTVAALLNALIIGAGILLVRHTRRSRHLAGAQMQFVANVSHELRTPLTVIRSAAHNLQRGVVQEPERIAQYSGLIIRHAEQLGDMVEQVLALAGAQRGSAMQRQPVSLIEVINDAIASTANDTETAQCEIEWQPPAALPVIIGDAAALRRALQNLITNAAKHGGAGHWIGISATANDHAVEVRVRDRGPGVPEREQATIFDPFVRGERAQSDQTRGSGLGLSLVREIAEAHGGRLAVHNDKGAVFTLQLPTA